jgi:glycine dehydrogenase
MSVRIDHPDTFVRRHIGPGPEAREKMLALLGVGSLDTLIGETVPEQIRMKRALDLPRAISENELLSLARSYGAENELFRSLLGMGYADTITPPVILRNVVENPGYYTQYTPYQAEISQGRLEALLNYQTMVCELTQLPVANASLLDEATAAAEAMHLAHAFKGGADKNAFFVSELCHPQTIDVVKTRAAAVGVTVVTGDHQTFALTAKFFGALVQYPATTGEVFDYRAYADRVHGVDALFCVAADILSLALLTPPGELGADVALGSTQRFGVPLGYGGPHAAYFATKQDYVRKLPGRIIGVSEDAEGRPALRMALQTREQHIRREKATSNICTAQALLAIVASMYAVYHGPKGLKEIAERVHGVTATLAHGLTKLGRKVSGNGAFFDTITVSGTPTEVNAWYTQAAARKVNLRRVNDTTLGVALDELTDAREVSLLLEVFGDAGQKLSVEQLAKEASTRIPSALTRKGPILTHPIFSQHHSETEMLRYIKRLEGRDISLAHSMIPLGSCTMKLNATAEMIPITMPAWNSLHPFAPPAQAKGYQKIFQELSAALAECTGFAGVSLQPNAGAQGEYAGLLVIRKYQETKGQGARNVCLIPASAHGTNPASAVMAGLSVVVVACDDRGNVDLPDLEAKAKAHADKLSCLMITYPSTHGVFEESIVKICELIHAHGGQVYMDGANMNAQVGLCRPGDFGPDVCHLNLHKTFAIPHGGGGPGMGPICVAPHLTPYLPRLPVIGDPAKEKDAIGPVSAAPWGSASILLISWAYIRMMGGDGLTEATKMAILNANYIAKRLDSAFPVVYKGTRGRVAHECIVDVRQLKKATGIEVEDIAKRLMDYGFHAPTMSFPIPGTLMIEPTESEPLPELDRFCDAMLSIRQEIADVESGKMPRDDNPLKHAPHTAHVVTAAEWKHPYSREVAAFPAPWTRDRKFFPAVARLNNALGDRKLICTCPPISDYA